MKRLQSLLVTLTGGLLLTAANNAAALDYFRYTETDVNMSILVMSCTLDGEDLVARDEIGVFTPGGDCAGASAVDNNGFPVGIAAWQVEGRVPGFRAGEQLAFRVWDRDADEELLADISEVVDGNPVFEGNSFVALSLEAARGEAVPDISVSVEGLDFGAVRVGRVAEQTFTVQNRGRATLTVSDMSIGGGPFAVNFQGEVEIAAGAARDFTVTFAPEEVDSWDETLTIVSDDPDNDQVTISLTGSGEAAAPPNIVLSANERSFGRVLIDQARNWSLFIGNNGDQTLVVSEISSDNNVFTTDFDDELRVAPDGNAQVVVTFRPAAAQAYEGSLTISSNDPDQGEVSVRLLGEGVEPGEPPSIGLYEEEHFYGNVSVGQAASWRMVILNSGGSDLMVQSVSSDHQAFNVNFPNVEQRVRPGDYLYVPVTFGPGAEGFYNATLTVASNDPENGEITAMVGGVATQADGRHFRYYTTGFNHSLLVVEATLDGNALGARSEVGVFTRGGYCAGGGVIGNDGRVGMAAMGDDEDTDLIDGFNVNEAFRFKVWDADARVEAWAAAEWVEGPEVFTGEFSVLRLAGRVVAAPDIELSDHRNFYGQVEVGSTEDWTFRITNRGQGVLTVEDVATDMNEFTTDFEGEFDIGVGDGRDITVTFAPSAEVDYAGRLTLRSSDPVDSVLYIDLFGLGVDQVREPELVLPRANHYFGVQRIGGNYNYVLVMTNRGGGRLRIDDVRLQGNGFATNWPGQPREVDPGNQYELTITFSPQQAQVYNGQINIISDDPNNGDIAFALRGHGTASQTRFNALATNVNHTLLCEQVILVTVQGNEQPFARGNEVGVFTPRGLCAGAAVMEEEGRVAVACWGDDVNTPFDDGFRNGDAFAFRMYDRATRQEIVPEVSWTEGPRAWESNGFTRLNLRGQSEVDAAEIVVDPPVWQFGPVRVGQAVRHTFRISNNGGVDLTVSRIASNFNTITHNFNNQDRVVRPGEGFDVEVTFEPARVFAYEGILTVFSDDARRPQFPFNPCGSGTNILNNQGQPFHFQYFETDQNHSVLAVEFNMGGAPADVNDEFAVFTPAGHCAGAGIVTNPGEGVGLSAWGDDADERILINGFRAGEEMTFRIWDASQRREYEPEIEVVEGELNWTANDFTAITLNVANVFRVNPPNAVNIRENERAAFQLTLANAPGQMAFAWDSSQVFQNNQWRLIDLPNANRGNIQFADNRNNTANFQWDANFDASGQYKLYFSAFNNNQRDQATAVINIADVNRVPQRIGAFADNRVTMNEDAAVATYALVDTMFRDPDGDALSYEVRRRDPQQLDSLRIMVRNNRPELRIKPALNFNGQIACSLFARDGRGGETLYQFAVVVNAVNDNPVIAPDSAQVRRDGREGVEMRFSFSAQDVEDQANQLVWTMNDRGGLPQDGPQFADNGDGSMTFVWTPQFNESGNYTPQFTVTDRANATDQIRVDLRIADVNRPPVRQRDLQDVEMREDQAREDIQDLNGLWQDPDGQNIQFQLIAPPAPLQLQINNGILSAQPTANFFTRDSTHNYDMPLRVRVRGHDGAVGDTVAFLVNVEHVNDRPGYRANAIANRNVREDTTVNNNPEPVIQIAASLVALISDVDNRTASCSFFVATPQDTNLVRLFRFVITNDAQKRFTYQLTPNFNTAHLENGEARVQVWALDSTGVAEGQGGDSAYAFNFRVRPLNDPPQAFNLVDPPNNHAIQYDPDSLGSLQFAWSSAIPNRWEVDTTFYAVTFRLVGGAAGDTVQYPFAPDTSRNLDTLRLPPLPFQPILDTLTRQRREDNRHIAQAIEWWVSAFDSARVLSRAANAPFRFNIPPLEVKQSSQPEIPQVFTMAPAYPNPFNSGTTLKFGLPHSEAVEIAVWDMHGRKVATLQTGSLQAGQYELNWNAEGLTSGIYIIKMRAGNFEASQKAVLVR